MSTIIKLSGRLLANIFTGLIAVLSLLSIQSQAQTYHLTGTNPVDINALSNWKLDGTGPSPVNFSINGATYLIPSGIEGELSGNFILGTTSSNNVATTMRIEGMLTIPSSYTFTMAFKRTANSTIVVGLILENGGSLIFQNSGTTQLLTDVAAGARAINFLFSVEAGAYLTTPNLNGINGTNGSVTNIDITASYSTSANYVFNGGNAQSLTGIPTTVNKLVIDGSGTKTLNSNLTVSEELKISAGILDKNNFSVEFGSTGNLHESGGRLTSSNVGLSTAVRVMNNPSAANPGGLGVVISTFANLGTVTISRGHSERTGNGTTKSILRHYTILPSGTNSGLDATLVIYYDDSELNGIEEANLVMFKSVDGTNWIEMPSIVDAVNNTVTVSGIDGFSQWTLGDKTNPLPIELTEFSATPNKGEVELQWITAAEINNDFFSIEKSLDLKDWVTLLTLPGAGNSNSMLNYHAEDKRPARGNNYYRLKQTDFDGAFSYSEVVSVSISQLPSTMISTPWTADEQLYINLAPATEATRFEIYNVTGQHLVSHTVPAGTTTEQIYFNIAHLSPGIYYLRVYNSFEQQVEKFMYSGR